MGESDREKGGQIETVKTRESKRHIGSYIPYLILYFIYVLFPIFSTLEFIYIAVFL